MEVYFKGKKQVFAEVNGFTIKTDQAISSGGDGEYPEPFTLFLASLAACAGIYVKSFCDQRGIPSEDIRLKQDHVYDPQTKMIGRISITIETPADFPEKYLPALEQVAGLCAVKKHLREDITLEVKAIKK